jgi:hypothetical protein
MKINLEKISWKYLKNKISVKRYLIVAYNNRMYEGFKTVSPELYTFFGANYWINQNGDRSRYVYDLYDVINKRLVIDHQPMIDEFNYVKESILKTSARHATPLRVYIFNFKVKWDKIYGKSATAIYFSDLMVIYKMQMEKTGISNYDPEDCNVWKGYEALI